MASPTTNKAAGAQTLSTKVPAELAAGIDRMALYRGVSRSFLLRELIEAALDHKVILTPPRGRQGMTIAELGASDVGRAARRKAQLDAEAACRGAKAAADGDPAAPGVAPAADVEELARQTAAAIAEGR